jgi:hypothetical protein
MSNPLHDPELLKALLKLREQSPDQFMDLVLHSLKKYPELAVEDLAPADHKLRALQSMLEYYEASEKYEDCAFLKEIKDQIKDEEDKIRRNLG